jgi:hypothetical protein
MLQNMDEFMADQHAADHRTHRPLLDGDRAQSPRFSAIGGVFPRQPWLTSHYRNSKALTLS